MKRISLLSIFILTFCLLSNTSFAQSKSTKTSAKTQEEIAVLEAKAAKEQRIATLSAQIDDLAAKELKIANQEAIINNKIANIDKELKEKKITDSEHLAQKKSLDKMLENVRFKLQENQTEQKLIKDEINTLKQ